MEVVTALAKDGFLTSIKGKGSDLELTEPSEKVSTGSVVHHLESMQLVECMGWDNSCLITPSYGPADILGRGIKAFLSYLDSFTLSGLLGESTYDLLYMSKVDILVKRVN